MDSPITNVLIVIAALVASRIISFEDTDSLNTVRAVYLITQLTIFMVYIYVRYQIRRKNDTTSLSTGTSITIYEYDCNQWKALLRKQGMGLGMVAIMHLYFKLPNPLLVQSILPLKSMAESKLVLIHVGGKPAVGDLQRPWEESPGLAKMWRCGQGVKAHVEDKLKSS